MYLLAAIVFHSAVDIIGGASEADCCRRHPMCHPPLSRRKVFQVESTTLQNEEKRKREEKSVSGVEGCVRSVVKRRVGTHHRRESLFKKSVVTRGVGWCVLDIVEIKATFLEPACRAGFASLRDFNVGEYRCNFCNCPYSSQSHLKRHLTRGCFMDPSFPIEERQTMNRAESRNYVCPKCSQGYKNKRTLDTHLRIACGREPKFHCPYCGLRSKHPPNIYTHIRRRHKGEDLFLIVDQDQRIGCILSYSYPFLTSLIVFVFLIHTHTRTHARISLCRYTYFWFDFPLYECARALARARACVKMYALGSFRDFVNRVQLFADSIRGDDTKRKYNCKYCGKGFTLSGHLRSHQKSFCYWNPRSTCHQLQKSRPFSCGQCGACYAKQSHLIFHVRHDCGIRTKRSGVITDITVAVQKLRILRTNITDRNTANEEQYYFDSESFLKMTSNRKSNEKALAPTIANQHKLSEGTRVIVVDKNERRRKARAVASGDHDHNDDHDYNRDRDGDGDGDGDRGEDRDRSRKRVDRNDEETNSSSPNKKARKSKLVTMKEKNCNEEAIITESVSTEHGSKVIAVYSVLKRNEKNFLTPIYKRLCNSEVSITLVSKGKQKEARVAKADNHECNNTEASVRRTDNRERNEYRMIMNGEGNQRRDASAVDHASVTHYENKRAIPVQLDNSKDRKEQFDASSTQVTPTISNQKTRPQSNIVKNIANRKVQEKRRVRTPAKSDDTPYEVTNTDASTVNDIPKARKKRRLALDKPNVDKSDNVHIHRSTTKRSDARNQEDQLDTLVVNIHRRKSCSNFSNDITDYVLDVSDENSQSIVNSSSPGILEITDDMDNKSDSTIVISRTDEHPDIATSSKNHVDEDKWMDTNDLGEDAFPFRCEYCTKRFKRPTNLSRHKNSNCFHNPKSTIHSSEETSFICKCGRRFKEEKSLVYHRRHDCEKFITCPIYPMYGQLHSSFIRAEMIGGGRAMSQVEGYQHRRDSGKDPKDESSFLYMEVGCRQEPPIPPPVSRNHWPDSVAVQNSVPRKKFYCPRCNSGYTRLSDMKTHCHFQCDLSFPSQVLTDERNAFVSLAMQHIRNANFSCPNCTSVFNRKDNLQKHLKYECGQLPRSGTSGRLQDTVQRDAKTDGISGPEQRQVSLSEVYEHFQPEEQFVFAFKVRVWSTTAIRLPLLRLRVEEILEHTRAQELEGNPIEYYGWNRRNAAHPRVRHKALHICPRCGRPFNWRYNLQNHLKYACGQLPRFNCPYCAYRTKHTSNVRAHVRRKHPNEEVYVVDLMSDTTAPFTVFGINVGIEDGQSQIGNIEKLWTRSSNQIDLDNNFKTKKFPCPNCACAYSQKYSLNRHLTYECGQEPRFKCPHCDYRCKKSANIYEHVRRRHKDCRVYAIDVLKVDNTEDA
ncbi:Zinc finger protein 37 [Eufriesea mexicana]|nr:Zinc finger protein 37 [Eufriesea mexicana]